tara:strand:+ start:2134 stop:3153 length:1020 start_codon:yes stop_codon:yes gene_type:complete
MAEGQTKSDSLPESQEANEGLKQNIGGLLDQAGLDRLMEPDSLFEPEQEESETPDPTHPVENEAEDGDDEEKESTEPSGEENEDSETESEVLSQSEEDDESGKGQDGLLKRIGKLTAIRKEAEGKVSTLEDEVADLRAQLEQKGDEAPTVVNSNVPYSSVVTIKDVDAKLTEAQEVYDWAEDNPNGAVQGDKDYSEEDVLAIKRRARKALRDLPKRKDYLLRERENSNVVENAFPYWKDRSHPMYQQAMEIVRNRPEIKSHAEWKADVTIYQMGLMAYEELQNSRGQKKPVAKAPAQPTKPTAAKKSVSKEKQKKSNAVKNFTTRRDRDSLTELMKGFI